MLLVGGRMVIDGNLSLGDFTAFYTYLVMLAGPMRMLGVAMGMAQRAIASGNRMFEILDREPRDPEPGRSAGRCPPAAAAVELRGVTLRYDAAPARTRRSGAAATSTSTVEAGQDGRAGRALGLGQDQPGRR